MITYLHDIFGVSRLGMINLDSQFFWSHKAKALGQRFATNVKLAHEDYAPRVDLDPEDTPMEQDVKRFRMYLLVSPKDGSMGIPSDPLPVPPVCIKLAIVYDPVAVPSFLVIVFLSVIEGKEIFIDLQTQFHRQS